MINGNIVMAKDVIPRKIFKVGEKINIPKTIADGTTGATPPTMVAHRVIAIYKHFALLVDCKTGNKVCIDRGDIVVYGFADRLNM